MLKLYSLDYYIRFSLRQIGRGRTYLLLGLIFLTLSVSAYSASRQDERAHFIVVSHGQANDPFWLRVKNGVEAAAREQNVKATYRAPESFDMVAMAQLIEAAIQQEPDGLVVSIPDADALAEVIQKAINAGIPTASINSGADISRELGTLFHVGSDEFKAGIMAGQRLRSAQVKHPVCVNHEVGNVSLDLRCSGVSEGYGKPVQVIPSTVNSVEAVYATIKAALQANESIDGIVALGATMVAEPTMKAMNELGRSDIYLGTFDLSPSVLEAIEADKIAFAIDQQQYLQGYLPIVHLNLYHQFKLRPPALLASGPGLISKENAKVVAHLSESGIR